MGHAMHPAQRPRLARLARAAALLAAGMALGALLFSGRGMPALRACIGPAGGGAGGDSASYVAELAAAALRRVAAVNAPVLAAVAHERLEYKEHLFQVLGHYISARDAATSVSPGVIAAELDEDDYDLRTLEVAEGDVLLDLGSNIGMTAILLAKMFPQAARVIGIEPAPANYLNAVHNVAANGVADRVVIVNAALSANTSTTLRLSWDSWNTGGGTTSGSDVTYLGPRDKKVMYYDVASVTLPELLAIGGYDARLAGTPGLRIPFVKLDCEGCEYDFVPFLDQSLYDALAASQLRGERHPRAREQPWVTKEMAELADSLLDHAVNRRR